MYAFVESVRLSFVWLLILCPNWVIPKEFTVSVYPLDSCKTDYSILGSMGFHFQLVFLPQFWLETMEGSAICWNYSSEKCEFFVNSGRKRQ